MGALWVATYCGGRWEQAIITIARELLGWIVVERRLALEEVLGAAEAFYTGTGTILAPVTTFNVQGVDHTIGDGQPGPRSMQLRRMLEQVQTRELPDL